MRSITTSPTSVTQRIGITRTILFEEDTICLSVKRPDTGTNYIPEYLISLKESKAIRCHKRR